MPSDHDLGGATAFSCCKLGNSGIGEHVAPFPPDGCVSRERDAPLLVESQNVSVVQVRMNLDLIDDRLDLTTSQQVRHHGDSAVADSNALDKADLDQLLHFLPNHVEGW